MTDAFIESLPKCEKCGLPKPERCHHCSVCNKCHLKMDHHCPAVGNCVAVRNFRSFLAMLLWSVIGSGLQGFFCLAEAILDQFDGVGRLIAIVYVVMSTFMAFWLWCFLGDQMARACVNQTTIEQIGRYELKYDLGREENMRQVYGAGAMQCLNPLPNNEMSGFEWSLEDYHRREGPGANI
jgi:palmitoyltransferase